MAKEFKDYDKQFSGWKGRGLELVRTWGYNADVVQIEEYIHQWDYIFEFTEAYTAAEIANAVYESATADRWQLFRVAMKGLTTRQKLRCLECWLHKHYSEAEEYSDLDKIRVNNYLGALKRGGFLDSNLNVIK